MNFLNAVECRMIHAKTGDGKMIRGMLRLLTGLFLLGFPAVSLAEKCTPPRFYEALPRDEVYYYGAGAAADPEGARIAALKSLARQVTGSLEQWGDSDIKAIAETEHDRSEIEAKVGNLLPTSTLLAGWKQDDHGRCKGVSYAMVRIEQERVNGFIKNNMKFKKDLVDELSRRVGKVESNVMTLQNENSKMRTRLDALERALAGAATAPKLREAKNSRVSPEQITEALENTKRKIADVKLGIAQKRPPAEIAKKLNVAEKAYDQFVEQMPQMIIDKTYEIQPLKDFVGEIRLVARNRLVFNIAIGAFDLSRSPNGDGRQHQVRAVLLDEQGYAKWKLLKYKFSILGRSEKKTSETITGPCPALLGRDIEGGEAAAGSCDLDGGIYHIVLYDGYPGWTHESSPNEFVARLQATTQIMERRRVSHDAATISGNWIGIYRYHQASGQSGQFSAMLTQKGDAFDGTYTEAWDGKLGHVELASGHITSSGKVNFIVHWPKYAPINFVGQVSADTAKIEGTWQFPEPKSGSGTFDMTRQ